MQKSPSHLKKANALFRQKKLEEAEEVYQKALQNAEGPLIDAIFFNIEYTRKKLREEVKQANPNALKKPDWLDKEVFEKIVDLALFDISFYEKKYPEIAKSEKNLLAHYLTKGVKEGLDPSEKFNTKYYINENPDVASAEINPFIHYVTSGRHEGRFAKPTPYITKYKPEPKQYIPRIKDSAKKTPQIIKPICFYLPQYHAIPENDKWWGAGFTEWTNVKPARPQYKGHYQPHIPHDDIGYYNLLSSDAQKKQIEIAKQYGVGGFCYYLYWFSGKRLLEKPLDNMLADPTIDFPFCVCWANENWSRRWDGLDHDLLMVQDYSEEDDIAFIENISKYLKDKRYIKIDNKPLILIYRPNLFPDMRATVKRWRDWCSENGIGEIYLAYPQSFEHVDPAVYDFDAALEFPPNNSNPPSITNEVTPTNEAFYSKVYDWRVLLDRSDNYKDPGYTLFRSTNPSWDNTARKKNKGIIFENNCPKLFEKYLTNAFSETLARRENEDERIVFINAWNEWAEGAHLEPDKKHGYAWLQAVRNSQLSLRDACNTKLAIVIHAFYTDVLEEILHEIQWAKNIESSIYITTPHEKKKDVEDVASHFSYKIFVRAYENKGRDVLPFLKTIPEIAENNHEFLIKIHTKKSLHRADGDNWRKDLYSQLLSFPKYVRGLIDFRNEKDLVLMSPDGSLVPISYYWGANEENVLKLCEKYQIKFSRDGHYKFIAGTMFVARVSFFKELVDKEYILSDDFDREAGQVDGTLAHAYERFFGIFAYEKSKKITSFGYQEKEFSYAEKTI
ncbi:glycoside hydrolase family 99-like domain-containing protein [Modicisalibacter tunisiensis]|uniref:Glycoside hydrolase family 99-like domain-containing protein n=1 Tax=Modicisalibacter tunisiensis TaxID=390637 RepID=A0ABS7WVN4_9GAMM|nr:glycoside hydrolase family 99-like domain-containing protein [Modicisalibacter tunisiensis]MBZ9566660.1 glycoside hydrolase family 99-like domain-containing protein [Modicisalibacter tunisiensis]